MPPIVKTLLTIIAVIVVIVIGFRTHWAIGTGLVLLLIGLGLFLSRSTIYAQLGNRAYMQGDTEKALQLLEKMYGMKSADPQHLVGYGYLLLRDKQLEKAEKVLSEALAAARTQETRMKAKVNLATANWLSGRKDEAIALLEEVHAGYKNTLVYANLGYFKLLHASPEEALAYNEEAHDYNDSDMTIMDNLAQTYYVLGRYEEAADMYAKVMEKTPKHADSYYYYALTLQKLGRLEEAREQAGTAAQKEPALVTTLTKADLEQLSVTLGAASGTETD